MRFPFPFCPPLAPQDITCWPCPEAADCPGGAVVVPQQGSWHSAANSSFMNGCPNPQACRDDDDEAQVGVRVKREKTV